MQLKLKKYLDSLGIVHEYQVYRFPSFEQKKSKHDFVINDEMVVECKAMGRWGVKYQDGTLWQKIPYAIHLLSSHGVPGIVVLDGPGVALLGDRLRVLRLIASEQKGYVQVLTFNEAVCYLSRWWVEKKTGRG